MELVVEPDMYSPSIDEQGVYIDKIPSFHIVKKGLMCPCGTRSNKKYDSYSSFTSHIKTKNHQKWLESLNNNRVNHYMENISLHETIHSQRMIIAKMEKDLANKSLTIDCLTKNVVYLSTLHSTNIIIQTDLLDFD